MIEGGVGQTGAQAEGIEIGSIHAGRVSTHTATGTTKQRRHRPLVIVHTGPGKGKTTAAMGLALRGWARGWSIGVVQFVKSGRWPTGEKTALQALGRIHADTGEGGPVHWYQAGAGWTWARRSSGGREPDAIAVARQGWREASRLLAESVHDLLILDELTHPARRGWLDPGEVAATIAARPGHQHVVITGRDCPAPMVAIADLVTEMAKVRHPYDAGIRGQRGIEW